MTSELEEKIRNAVVGAVMTGQYWNSERMYSDNIRIQIVEGRWLEVHQTHSEKSPRWHLYYGTTQVSMQQWMADAHDYDLQSAITGLLQAIAKTEAP